MQLTREEALKYHRMMWTDMQTALGDKPSFRQRDAFKQEWCKEHFPEEKIESHCFLCEYCDDCVSRDTIKLSWNR